LSGHRESDTTLVARCLAGDADGWSEIVNRYARYVYAIPVRGFELGEHDAEDVFQETFARAYERLSELRDPGAVKPWLAQTARRLCVDRVRAQGREEPSDDPVPDEGTDFLAQLDEALTVRAALTALPETCQEVLDRFFCRDESYRTIGAALDIPSGTIASRISRCLARLREALEGRPEAASPSSEASTR
jgi:RNA polymerase sigma-70 factor (ECF subfamily)